MKVAIIGASGKLGTKLVRESLRRGYRTVAVCRDSSSFKLDAFKGQEGFTLVTARIVSDEMALMQALDGCDAVVAILISVRDLKATELVKSLARAGEAKGIRRFVFTAGEVTAVRQESESYTLRQWLMYKLVPPIVELTPYSMKDMLRSSQLVYQQSDRDWTIVRAPTLTEKPPVGYMFCDISEVTSGHSISRDDYAACLLDSLGNPEHYKRVLTIIPAS